MSFTKSDVFAAVNSNIADAVRFETLDADSVVDQIADLLDSNSYTAPDVIYYHDAYEVVAGSDFNDVTTEELDFSDCKGALDCLTLEANTIVYACYNETVTAELETISELINDAVDSLATTYKLTTDEIKGVAGFNLETLPHTLEFDIKASNGTTVSCLLWAAHKVAAFQYESIYIQFNLSSEE